jgi:hypothetical protein
MARRRFVVSPNKREGGWRLTSRGISQPFDTKQEAVNAAAKQARSMGNSQVVIQKRDGTIQSERTYGNDPRRTKGRFSAWSHRGMSA